MAAALPSRPTFVGRGHELAALDERLAVAAQGQGGVVLLAGEPGIGKTRLAEELAALAHARGARALWGRCYEGEGAPAFWPWVEILRAWLRRCDPDTARTALGPGAAVIAQLVPDVRRLVPDLPEPLELDPAQARFRLFDAIAAFLGEAGAAQPPLLLILDDLHWADTPTLLLLEFLARDLAAAPILVVGTYRDVEVLRGEPLARTLGELLRRPDVIRFRLAGLSVQDVARMIAVISGPAAIEPGLQQGTLAARLHEETEGNPLFVQELVRLLATEGRAAPPLSGQAWRLQVPPTLREVIGRRLNRLSPECSRALTMAAVVGREFELDVLGRAGEAGSEALLEVLEEAEAAHLIAAVPGTRGRFRFGHALIRETLYEDLPATRRARLHLRVAEAIEAVHAHSLGEQVATLAVHYRLAGATAPVDKAIHYARRAAEAAAAVAAWEEAVTYYEAALALLGHEDPAARCDLLLALGATLMPAGEPRRVFEEVAPEAFALAEALGEAGRAWAARVCRLALVALIRYSGPGVLVTTPLYQVWAERADHNAPPDTADRIHADIALADALSGVALDETLKRYQRALALARGLDEPDTLFYAAFQLLNWAGGSGYQAERLRLAEEFSTRPRDGVRPRNVGRALWRCGAIVLDWGERTRAETLWRRVAELGAREREPDLLLYGPIGDAILATLDGELEEALRAAARLIERSAELGSAAFGRRYAARLQERPLLWLGRTAAVPAVLSPNLAASLPDDVWTPANAASAALRRAQDGDLADARRALAAGVRQLQAAGADDANFPWHLVTLLELAVLLGDRAACAFLAERLAVLAPCATADWGLTTVARHLGEAAAVLGDRARVRRYYDQALAVAGRIDFRPEVALTRLQLAELLEGDSTGRTEALAHLDFVIAEF